MCQSGATCQPTDYNNVSVEQHVNPLTIIMCQSGATCQPTDYNNVSEWSNMSTH
jgi:hypothetical protein